MIGAPVPGVVNALQVTIPGRLPQVPSVKALGNARDEKKNTSILSLLRIGQRPIAIAYTYYYMHAMFEQCM